MLLTIMFQWFVRIIVLAMTTEIYSTYVRIALFVMVLKCTSGPYEVNGMLTLCISVFSVLIGIKYWH